MAECVVGWESLKTRIIASYCCIARMILMCLDPNSRSHTRYEAILLLFYFTCYCFLCLKVAQSTEIRLLLLPEPSCELTVLRRRLAVNLMSGCHVWIHINSINIQTKHRKSLSNQVFGR